MVNAFYPKTLIEALNIRHTHDTMIINGATDILPRHRPWSGTSIPYTKDVLYLQQVSQTNHIEIKEDVVRIGLGVTYDQFLEHPAISDCWKTPIRQIGSQAIRNQATLIGNVCNASPAGDVLPLLYALDGKMIIQSLDQQRILPIQSFILGPGQIDLQHDEIVTHIEIPIHTYNKTFYHKVGARKANAISKVSVFAVALVIDDIIHDVRISIGACAPTVIRCLSCEDLLKQTSIKQIPTIIQEVLAEYDTRLRPIDDVRSTKEYRRQVALNLIEAFLLKELII